MRRMCIMLGLCALFINASCESKKHEEKELATHFLATTPVRMDTSITVDYVSQIHAIQHIKIRAQERGYLEKIYVDEGQHVKKGQLLFQIMPRLYEAEMQKAKAEAEFANIEYLNTKQLADSEVVSMNELALAKAKLDKAKAELALRKVHLDFTEIRAPYDGIIDKFHVRLGSLIDEGDLLTYLSDNSKMWVYFNVPEAVYLDYQTNMDKDSFLEVGLKMANNKFFPHRGIVETIEADFNNETGNIPFRATFPNPTGLLRHGETGNIEVKERFNNAIVIPQKATFEVLDQKYVYVIDANDELQSRKIEIEAEMPDLYVVKSGLDTSDKILLEGLRNVREHDKIEYELHNPKEVLSTLRLHAE
ncbi:efflux RND transporter periplasmic adaptor subunit [Lishizhenia sp.]|uniref:efflux RND transporter periplasmic adaptor subunit n=1 Tax=Lishizhenia sp. TaxID=2497594 RepID=UPI00299F038B|nr:efflux RND transporter periplasmic adaptor subunit [Lishizhenia sp.]MDX1446535.1 efflux RND transporter periplasmic adaptor subunit [Lishizhenia sp.]